MPEHFIGGNRVCLLHDGAAAFPEMLAAIEAARGQVLLEMYWFDSDATGRRFASALVAAAKRGVEVALVYDSVGSWESDPRQFDDLAAAGARVVEFDPIAPWRRRFRLDRLTRRDHRKLLIVDRAVAFTGGVNLADPWAPAEEEGGRGWRDDVVSVRGPIVGALADAFMNTWTGVQGEPIARLEVDPTAVGTHAARVLTESARRREIIRAYLHNIYLARQRVWIANAYFLPDHRARRALIRAAQRGVDVRILVPGRSDVEIIRYAGRALWSRLMRHGVRIFEWQGGMLHSKTAIIDGTWSTIGSFNFDYLSLRSNLEVNVAVRDAQFGAQMETSFQQDLSHSIEVDPHDFFFRPLSERLVEMIFYRLRRLL